MIEPPQSTATAGSAPPRGAPAADAGCGASGRGGETPSPFATLYPLEPARRVRRELHEAPRRGRSMTLLAQRSSPRRARVRATASFATLQVYSLVACAWVSSATRGLCDTHISWRHCLTSEMPRCPHASPGRDARVDSSTRGSMQCSAASVCKGWTASIQRKDNKVWASIACEVCPLPTPEGGDWYGFMRTPAGQTRARWLSAPGYHQNPPGARTDEQTQKKQARDATVVAGRTV